MVGYLYEAMLLEKKNGSLQRAELAYQKSLEIGSGLKSEEAKHFRSYAYAGLARLADQQRQYSKARDYYQSALSQAQYPATKAEAKAYLD